MALRVAIEQRSFPDSRPVSYLKEKLRSFSGLDVVVPGGEEDLVITSGYPFGKSDYGCAALSIQYGTESRASPLAPGFWESLSGTDGTGFTIWGSYGRGQEWEPLLSGFFRTLSSPRANAGRILLEPLPHLCTLVEVYLSTRTLHRGQTVWIPNRPSAPKPSFKDRIEGAVTHGRRQATRVKRRIKRRGPRTWFISYLSLSGKEPDWQNSTVVSAPRNHFYADPFLVRRNDRLICLFEDFDLRLGRACISALEIEPSGSYAVLGPVIEEPFHLSFPFPFKYEDRLFVVPESAAAGEVRLYECLDFPMRWRLHSVALDNTLAFDPMIFPSNEGWQMLASVTPPGMGDTDSRLNSFWASDPISGPWVPSDRLPILIDPRMARNAGFISQMGSPIRAAQHTTMETYGAGLRIPGAPEYAAWEFDGGHHIHVEGDTAVRDWIES
jgi:hypothetical protein